MITVNSLKVIIVFIIVMLLSVLPLPVAWSAFKPDLFLLWLLAINYDNSSEQDSLCYSWVVGLLANIYYDLPLGSIAIIYVSLSYIFTIYCNKSFASWQKNIFIIASIAAVEAIMLVIRSGSAELTNDPGLLPVILITAIVWYCYVYLFNNKALLKR